ncbi:sensor histidine kinase [Lutispora thermophila]|uniref:histidine kinase n=1 Tax=Lutispora thermophila DSM 19022 TaxID=1122184 RepID=A0A1M6D4V6_9FIRM|nr:HAMP domain-containing sensor histidine kinase [Lutispora thermophila]SHI68038.1 Signal transduction histidine kinase [Lutispora thermophila DSM 19022]
MIKKLRIKFVIINMSIVTIMLCVILGLVFYFTRVSLEAESINMMQNIANRPFQLGVPNELGEDVRLPFFTIQLGPRGEVMETGGGYYDLSDREFLDYLINATITSPRTFAVIEEYNLRYYRVDTPLNHFLVFSDISSERATLNNMMRSCLIIGALSFLVFLGISIELSKWAVKPVELAWKQQRQFVADASHELKTPLTVIITNAELAQCPEYDEESKQKFLGSILTMSRQMRGLIEQMLELARADNYDFIRNTEVVDFSKLVSDAILPFEPVFFERGLNLTTKIDENIKVKGSKDQLCQVLDVLLDNAQKYSKEAGTTWVTLKRLGRGRCLLVVANEGDSIPPEETKNIFKRFYRIDKARSRTCSFGLGLSIAETVVTQHRGKIWVESRTGINYFHVELPCS